MITLAPPVAAVVPEADVVLRDGSTVHVRTATPADEPRVRAFLASLSDESRWFRFFSAGVNLDWAAHSAAAEADGLSLLALRGPEGTVVGHGTYLGGPDRAEVAFAVADAWHGHGIATVLLAHLAHAASAAGIATFTATVLPSNHRMLQVFHDSGFAASGAARRTLSRSSCRPRSRATRGCSSRSASAPPTSRPSATSCDPLPWRSSARPAGTGPWAARSCGTCSPRASPVRCTSSTREAARSAGGRPSAASPTSRVTWSSRSSPSPRLP